MYRLWPDNILKETAPTLEHAHIKPFYEKVDKLYEAQCDMLKLKLLFHC